MAAAVSAETDTAVEEYDPWEPFNEKMFSFNYNFDKYLLKPVAKGYNVVVPDELQQMIGHGFNNINVVPKLANTLLQGNLKLFSTKLGGHGSVELCVAVHRGSGRDDRRTVNDRSLNLDLFQGFEETTVDLYSAVRNAYL